MRPYRDVACQNQRVGGADGEEVGQEVAVRGLALELELGLELRLGLGLGLGLGRLHGGPIIAIGTGSAGR
ncbi:hypothetical protein ACGFWF_28175 [Streptomyces sp. NPDC048581]|uniref:hypothetical protein n=1 Tax=Streptomyces sp. NPDC048581 TaxID=3365572 RepID=UPI0037229E34